VIIAGGGIGGLALAQSLRKTGVDVAVYERDRHRTDRLQGFRIHISPHGSAALHECLPTDLFSAFVASSGKGGAFRFATEQLDELLRLDVHTGGPPERGHYGVSRITLRQILLAGLGDAVHFDKQLLRYEREPGGPVTAYFADGSSATGDVLVGADGAGSRVRAQYLPQARRIDTGVLAIAGKYLLTEESRARLAPMLLDGPVSVIPPKACGMFCAPHEFDATAPMPAGVGGNDQHDPGLHLDNTKPYVFWAFAAKRAGYPIEREPETLDRAQLHQLAKLMIADWSPDLRRLVGESAIETTTTLPILSSEPIQPWDSTNVTLLGDAIHSMTPFRGIGANTALRDAQLLGRKLIAADRDETPLVAGIHAYEAEMIDYGFAAVRASLRSARQAVAPSRTGRVIAKTVFRTFNAVPPLKRLVFADHGDE
jgi:2-polyprenyl-6-methoxyphenol hydroxylase-like FAD-dependent oxidoreductase